MTLFENDFTLAYSSYDARSRTAENTVNVILLKSYLLVDCLGGDLRTFVQIRSIFAFIIRPLKYADESRESPFRDIAISLSSFKIIITKRKMTF